MLEENVKKQKNNIEEEVDDALNLLYKSTIDINALKKQNTISEKNMQASDFNLDKELAQSKAFININEVNDTNKFLKKRKWDSLDDNKFEELEEKYQKVCKELDKNKIKDLIRQINNCNLEKFYNDFKPKINNKTIGSVSSLDFMIENTFNGQEAYYDIMITDKAQLEPYMYKFRSVLGDGDCFYRGVIFSFLENIILTNNIMLMKELLILYHEKINTNNKLLKDKEYLYVFYQMNISIVSQILYIFIDLMENNSKLAYNTLLKIFLYCPDFDFSIIYFTRYLIYEYISANENKLYSNDFQVEVGLLLPEDYVKEKGEKNEYLFENYYSLQLMQPKSFAEKIVVYITPFVFNIDMNVIIYDYGTNGAASFIEQKPFSCEEGSKASIEINLLFRKAHYDIFYKQKYFEEYQNMFNVLKNIKEDIKVINKKREEIIKSLRPKKVEENKENKENKELKEQKEQKKQNLSENQINKGQVEEHILDSYSVNDDGNLITKNNYKDNNDNYNESICMECKKSLDKINVFYLCNDCLLNNLKSALLTVFFEFIQNRDNLIDTKNKLNKMFQETKCTISKAQKNIPISTAIINSNYKFDDLFADVRSLLCLYCGENLKSKSEYYIELPCKCRICSQKCFLNYVEIMKSYITLNDNPSRNDYVKHINFLNCFCGYQYHSLDVLYMIKETDKNKLKEQKEMYQNYLVNLWNWRCMSCQKTFNRCGQFYRIILETDKIDVKLLKSKDDLRHLICGYCYEKLIKDEKNIYCQICEFFHTIKKKKEVDEYNKEEGCTIF